MNCNFDQSVFFQHMLTAHFFIQSINLSIGILTVSQVDLFLVFCPKRILTVQAFLQKHLKLVFWSNNEFTSMVESVFFHVFSIHMLSII